MKKRKIIKKVVKKNNKADDIKLNKVKNKNEVDLWKEIRTNLKPFVKAYNKFSNKRKITKQKEEEKKLRQDEKQRVREEEIVRLQEQEERIFQREKKIKEEKAKRLQEQEQQRLEEKRIRDDRDEQIQEELIYRERLIKGEQERINQLKKVNEARNEERLLREERESREERYLDAGSKLLKEKNLEEQRLKDEEHRLYEKEQRLKEKEQKLKEKEKILKEDEQVDLKDEKKLEVSDTRNKKRLNGTVLWFNDTKGYGFIKREDKEKDIFVHFSVLQNSGINSLKKDDQLTFEVEISDKGPSAVNLQKTVNEPSHLHLQVVK
jgi:CspA family cold shock protein